MSETRQISVTVNGAPHQRAVDSRWTLADFLRHELGLYGTHLGCEHGVCGACTVLLNGQSARSCLMLAVQADGKPITTVEGLAADGALNPLQQAFRAHHALQCGFCTPGILMSLTELLATDAASERGRGTRDTVWSFVPLHRLSVHRRCLLCAVAGGANRAREMRARPLRWAQEHGGSKTRRC